MLDEKCLELLHAEIDGELSAAERAELSRRLLMSAEARALREDLRRACAELDRLPMAEPPAELSQHILASPRVAIARNGTARGGGRRFTVVPVMRYAAVFVGGLLVSAIAFEASRGLTGRGMEDVAGTMASAPAASRMAVGTLRVDLPELRGTLSFQPSAGELLVQFKPDAVPPAGAHSPGSIEVVVARGEHEVHLKGFAAPQQAEGAPGFAVTLPGPVAAGEVVAVRILASGVLVHEDQWRAPAAG
jgi:hypothetical protein